jgi:hypothetical protein
MGVLWRLGWGYENDGIEVGIGHRQIEWSGVISEPILWFVVDSLHWKS